MFANLTAAQRNDPLFLSFPPLTCSSAGRLTPPSISSNSPFATGSFLCLFLNFTNSGSAGQLNLKRSTSTDQEAIFYYGSSNLEIETREATGIKLKTNKSDKVIIFSDGRVSLGGNLSSYTSSNMSSAGDDLVIAPPAGNNGGITIVNSGSNDIGNIFFANGTGETAIGRIQYEHQYNVMSITVNSGERIRIGSDGKFIHSCTGAEGVDFGTTNSNGAYIKFDLSASGATTGYIGAGNQLVTGAAVADFGFRSQGNMVFATGGDVQRLSIDSSGGGVTSTGDIRVDRGTTGSDGLLGQAYGGYFGIKHADQTYGSEYMMISNDTNTYISCFSGGSILLRPSANSGSHETVFAHDNSTFKTNIVMDNHPFRRLQHNMGHMEGGQNNIGATDAKSSPIYTIGSSYNPAETTLGNMYGIGFAHGNASFTPSGAGWGLYVASDGNSRISVSYTHLTLPTKRIV